MGIGLIFPGQGSQQVGMGASFLAGSDVAAGMFEAVNDALGFDLKALCLEGPEEELTLTYNAQAAILTVSAIAYRLLGSRMALQPLFLAGHSVGEYTALVASGVLSLADGVQTVYQRGRFMQEATPVGVGAMAAILGLDAAAVETLCREEAQGEVVAPANFNTPTQIVISGHDGAVKRVLARAKGKLLTVSAPFHSALMAPAARKMTAVLDDLSFMDARTPVVTNYDNSILTRGEDFKPSLIHQIDAPVRWDTGIQAMVDHGVTRFVELGHGKVLNGLMRRIDKTLPVSNVEDMESLQSTIEVLKG
ncbi:MAG: ACP S-malonyltransferase [SAR324 cluster bacterium]|nr:ACP S-malonyltransferase [SAR324 cluster bacterium]